MEQYKMLINCQSKGNSQERQKLTHIEYGDTKLKIASRELAVIQHHKHGNR